MSTPPYENYFAPAFSGVRSFMRLPVQRDLQGIDIAIAGVPFDTGTTYRAGARFGPEGVRANSMLLRAHNTAQGVTIFEHCKVIDYGDLTIVPGYLPESHQAIEADARALFQPSLRPIFIGGDHSVSLPLLRAAAAQYGPLALVHFDAHGDVGHGSYGGKDTHGTPFRRAAEEDLLDLEHSIQVGLRGSNDSAGYLQMSYDLMAVITGPELHEIGVPATLERICQRVGNKQAYLTFDIDFVDPAFAPGTGVPEVGGFSSYQVLQLLRGLQGIPFVGYDCVEVMPPYDPTGITSLLAANIILEFMTLTALQHKHNMK